jgi:hypothetical protein
MTIVSGASGSGNGLLMYSVQPNSSTAFRSGSLSIAGLTLSVTQSGAASSVPPLSPSSATFSSTGGRGSVTVTLPQANEPWTATSNAAWITITSGASSSGGNHTVNYAVAANSGAPRTGNITVAGLAFTVAQSGTSCSYGVTLGNMLPTTGGFNGSAKISTAAACPWSATTNVTWISVTSGSPGTGPGTLDFFVANNPNSAVRIGDLTVAGYVIQVTEGAKGDVKIEKPVH